MLILSIQITRAKHQINGSIGIEFFIHENLLMESR